MHTLVIPPAAQRDTNSVQMLSAWIAEQGLHCTLNIGMWKENGTNEPAAWGVLLADVVRHIANAHQGEYGWNRAETIVKILDSMQRELDEPTSEAQGDFHPGHS